MESRCSYCFYSSCFSLLFIYFFPFLSLLVRDCFYCCTFFVLFLVYLLIMLIFLLFFYISPYVNFDRCYFFRCSVKLLSTSLPFHLIYIFIVSLPFGAFRFLSFILPPLLQPRIFLSVACFSGPKHVAVTNIRVQERLHSPHYSSRLTIASIVSTKGLNTSATAPEKLWLSVVNLCMCQRNKKSLNIIISATE